MQYAFASIVKASSTTSARAIHPVYRVTPKYYYRDCLARLPGVVVLLST